MKRSATIELRHIGLDDAPLMAEMEEAAWGPLRASEDTIRRRLALGHTMIAGWTGSQFAGAICFTVTNQDAHDTAAFPKNFTEFSSLPRSGPPVSLYTYNLGVRPEYRGTNLARRLMKEMLRYGQEIGARWMVFDGRCPSYAGAQVGAPDKVRANPEFRAALDEWDRTGVKPHDKTINKDPLLRFYHRTLNCRFLHLARDFLPEDTSSGGYRVIFAVDL